ncbi:MAG: electron transfer flavoprotein subunit alpha/FixB family protein [Acidimicrobiia bacterium]|nr:electron transfer flavoprotein subunit alpha/FixB family protein [Acidimicrobiia bacterium]
MKIWVFAESEGDKPTTATLECCTKAREFGTVECLYVGSDADVIAPQLGAHGVAKVFAVDAGDGLTGITGGAAIAGLVEAEQPDLIMFVQSGDGRDAMAIVSARCNRTVLTNGVGLGVDGDAVTVNAAIFGGNTLVATVFDGPKPFLAGIRPKSFVAEPGGAGAAEVVAVGSVETGRAGEAKVLERHVEEREGPKLEEAAVVVSGGRGIGAEENYKPLVEELANLLNGASGASRAIVDAGWVPYSKQVGQTGKTVKPKVYIALGISGATQHMVGMKGSDNIIAVNKDGEAPIFSIADIGIVGDVHKVVPALIEALKNRS